MLGKKCKSKIIFYHGLRAVKNFFIKKNYSKLPVNTDNFQKVMATRINRQEFALLLQTFTLCKFTLLFLVNFHMISKFRICLVVHRIIFVFVFTVIFFLPQGYHQVWYQLAPIPFFELFFAQFALDELLLFLSLF